MNPLIFKRIHIGLGYNRSLLFSFYNISSQVDMLFRNFKIIFSLSILFGIGTFTLSCIDWHRNMFRVASAVTVDLVTPLRFSQPLYNTLKVHCETTISQKF